jgi:DNA-binding CsgD family transcriptional regulator
MKAEDAIEALSEKEREALRLLLAGHDAKSSARKLGVSHHAIHDRLRRAREKLGTTGSRQAALLLSESEKATPHSIVHEPFGGEANAASPEDPSSANMKRPASSWSQRRSKGLIIMSVSILIVAAAIAMNSHGVAPWKNAEAADARTPGSEAVITSPPQTTNTVQPVEKIAPAQARSVTAAREFMALLDAGEAAASYEAAAPTFRDAHGFDLWRLGVAIRASDGGAQRRTLVAVERDGNPSNPVHEALEILTFDTIMLNGERKAERLVMALIDGRWQAANIDVEDVNED